MFCYSILFKLNVNFISFLYCFAVIVEQYKKEINDNC